MTKTPEEIMARAIHRLCGHIFPYEHKDNYERERMRETAKAAIKALADEGFVIVPSENVRSEAARRHEAMQPMTAVEANHAAITTAQGDGE